MSKKNSKTKIIAAAVIIIAAVFYFNKSKEKNVAKKIKEESKAIISTPKTNPKIITKNSKKKSLTPVKIEKEKPDSEEKSLESLANVLFKYTEQSDGKEQLVEQLKEWQLKPVVVSNDNGSTGKMATIRTQVALKGTRYFHAQFFDDENGGNFAQHMSFEFRPGKKSLNKAVATAKQVFKVNRAPDVDKKDFKSWSLENGYNLWIKVMGKEDLKDDPYNAYTEDDIGTIRVAIELEIHGDDRNDAHDTSHLGHEH